ELLSDPDVISDTKKLRDYSKEQSDLEEVVQAYRTYKDVEEQLKDAKEMLEDESDDDMQDMAKAEIEDLSEKEHELEERLRILLLPKEPNDDKNVFMGIRAAAGGDEAAVFGGALYRMYSKYAEAQGWKIDVIETSSTGVGGYKGIIFMVN